MTTHKAIRDALEAGPTEGTWSAGIPGGAIISDQHVEHGPNGCDCVQYYGGHLIAESIAKRNLEFIAACNPAAIRALLADLDAKTAEVQALRPTAQPAALAGEWFCGNCRVPVAAPLSAPPATQPATTERKGEPVAWMSQRDFDLLRERTVHRPQLATFRPEHEGEVAIYTSPQVPEDHPLMVFAIECEMGAIQEHEAPLRARKAIDAARKGE